MATLVGSLSPRSAFTSLGNLELEGARDIHTVAVGDRTFVYVTGIASDSISRFELTADGTLTKSMNLPDSGALEIDGACNVISATVGGSTYLYVSGYKDDGLSAFRVQANGALTSIQNIDDANSPLELDGPRGHMTTITVGTNSFVVATGHRDNGLSVFRVNSDGTLANTDNVDDDESSSFRMNLARDTTTAVVDGRSFVFVAGYGDDGISVFELDGDGTLAFRSSVDDTSSPALQIDGVYGMTTATVADVTYLVTSGRQDDGLSVFRVDGSGQLSNVDNVEDNQARGLEGARGLTTFTLEGETFVSVSSATDNALSVFHLGTGGVLTDVTSVFDNGDLALRGSRYNTFTTVDGVPLLLATGQDEGGVSSFEVGGGADALKGDAAADILLGLAGKDNLKGGGGKDTILGGTGDDELTGGTARDRLEGGKGADDFIFVKAKESGPSGGKRDHIDDFKGKDEIILNKVDADTTDKGNQAFHIDHDGAFDTGDIRVKDTKGGVLLQMNTDHDTKVEMSILLSDFHDNVRDSDFVF